MERANSNSEFEFMTKKEFIEKLGGEKLTVKPELEEKLKTFDENTILAIEMTINSPIKVIDIEQFDISIVDFINKKFEEDGMKREVVNEIFGELNKD
nr:hypothetical protein [Candidatus Woesearchaeota archaeon]